jgi:hypothetical protein
MECGVVVEAATRSAEEGVFAMVTAVGPSDDIVEEIKIQLGR